MTPLYTLASKNVLKADIRFIDEQLDFARRKMQAGDSAEAWSTLDSLLGYYDFKKHFPDILVNDRQALKFMDVYEVLREIDNLIEVDATAHLGGGTPPPWRPQHSRDDIIRKLREYLQQLDRWKAFEWFEGDDIKAGLDQLKRKIEAYLRFFQNDMGQPVWGPVIDVRSAKKILLNALSDDLPFWEAYEKLLSMDRNLRFLVFEFRLHADSVTLELVERVIKGIEEAKHAILAVIDATRAEDEALPEPEANPEQTFPQPPAGWDDLQPFPPYGYAMVGPESIMRHPGLRRGSRSAKPEVPGDKEKPNLVRLSPVQLGLIVAITAVVTSLLCLSDL